MSDALSRRTSGMLTLQGPLWQLSMVSELPHNQKQMVGSLNISIKFFNCNVVSSLLATAIYQVSVM